MCYPWSGRAIANSPHSWKTSDGRASQDSAQFGGSPPFLGFCSWVIYVFKASLMTIQFSPAHPKNRISTKPYREDHDWTLPTETEAVWGIKAEPRPSFYQHLHPITVLSSSTSPTYFDHNDVCENYHRSVSCHSCHCCSTGR
jgi:hypothetical protein